MLAPAPQEFTASMIATVQEVPHPHSVWERKITITGLTLEAVEAASAAYKERYPVTPYLTRIGKAWPHEGGYRATGERWSYS